MEMKTYDILFEKLKYYNIVRGSAKLREKYPFDIAYNVIATDKYLIGKLNYVDESIIKIAKSKKLKFINVKQGYTRCSTIVIENDIFISSDIGIYNELKKNNIHVYYVKADDIILSDRVASDWRPERHYGCCSRSFEQFAQDGVCLNVWQYDESLPSKLFGSSQCLYRVG